MQTFFYLAKLFVMAGMIVFVQSPVSAMSPEGFQAHVRKICGCRVDYDKGSASEVEIRVAALDTLESIRSSCATEAGKQAFCAKVSSIKFEVSNSPAVSIDPNSNMMVVRSQDERITGLAPVSEAHGSLASVVDHEQVSAQLQEQQQVIQEKFKEALSRAPMPANNDPRNPELRRPSRPGR